MKILKFRIKNFRSIIDTGWCSFSIDGVTVLVGQNESGKSAILEALSTTFSSARITEDDLRFDCPLPEISFEVLFEKEELAESLVGNANKADIEKILIHFDKHGHRTQISFNWFEGTKDEKRFLDTEIIALEPELDLPAEEFLTENGEDIAGPGVFLSVLAGEAIFRQAPYFTLFQSDSGLLPNTINITPKNKLIGDGITAASNLLSIADIEISELVQLDNRSKHSKITRAINKINQEFIEFWNQNIGPDNKIRIEFSLEHHNNSFAEQSGSPYLAFWISDGLHKLHPKQRSAGVRWFISFYLQLKASQKLNKKIHFLLDEPGANLHANAQKDVLKLINTLSSEIPITYSTHSPTLIEHDKLYRVYAIQRKNDDPETPTEIIDAHQLGAASSDTLSPILMAIGTDLSHQNVIQKNNNIILEEASGFYYLKSFWELLEIKEKVHFIAATGVNKIPALANMFTGWGLNFSVIIDDESQSRAVYNKLKKELCGEDDTEANKKIYKIKGCKGIEDIFSKSDFLKHILTIDPSTECAALPSEIVKSSKYSKPVLAYSFALKVKNKDITFETLDTSTQEKIRETTNKIIELLQFHKP